MSAGVYENEISPLHEQKGDKTREIKSDEVQRYRSYGILINNFFYLRIQILDLYIVFLLDIANS